MLKKLSLTLSTLVVTTVASAQADSATAGDVPAAPELEWALAFVMSYDNDLEHCGPIILDGLEAGVKSDKVRVLVLHDDKDRGGLKRWVITDEGRSHERLETDDIADESVVASFLEWVADRHPAKRYAVIYLNHGGDLDNMCFDAWAGPKKRNQWLSARKMGDVMRSFRKRAPGTVELLFLQQCGRGSIDNLYNFRETATAVMASQFTVGAPNTYYTPTVAVLSEAPKTSAVELAKTIMRTDEHFLHYVCVDGKRLSELPARIDPVLETLIDADVKPPQKMRPCFGGWTGEHETNYDLLEWLGAASAAQENGTLDAFARWVRNDLIVADRGNPQGRRQTRGRCGLSLYVPAAAAVRNRYRDYPLRRASRLGELWNAIYPAAKQP